MEARHARELERERQLPGPTRRADYRIILRGSGSPRWLGALGSAAEDNGDGTTTLYLSVDQAGLRGVLNRLWDLNATILAVAWLPPATGIPKEGRR